MERTRTHHRRRGLARIALLTGLVVLSTGCYGTWGVRKSYRDWTVESSTFNPTTRKGTVQLKGTVSTIGHETSDGYVLDNTFTRPRLVINGNDGTIYVDLTYRPFEGIAPVGINAAMRRIGWDQFYGLPVALDAFSVRFKPA
jgi:hypothetical protein